MSSLYFLNDKDFYIGDGIRGQLLYTTVKGIVLVFFSATMCEICQNFIPEFKQLPQMVAGCQFAIINLSSYPKVFHMSKQTIMPLTEVPYIVLYVNGKPMLRYDDIYDATIIANFISSTVRKLQDNPDESVLDDVNSPQIPAYSIGKPIVGRRNKQRVCYLNFDGAYVSEK